MATIAHWKIRSQLLFAGLLTVVLLSGSLMAYTVVTTVRSGRQEITSYRTEILNERKEKLWDHMNLAYETIQSQYENATDAQWLEDRYGPELERILDIAAEIVENERNPLPILEKMRYGGGSGYLWICDTSDPIPQIIIHPERPDLVGRIPDSEEFEIVGRNSSMIDSTGSDGTNLFAAARNVVADDGSGFLLYDWPKLMSDGKFRDRLRLTHLRLIPELGWIIGTDMFVDGAMDEAKTSSKETLRDMRYDDGEGYFWITDTKYPVPTMLMDAAMPNLEGSVLDDPSYHVEGDEATNMFVEMLDITSIGGSGYLRVRWPKPTRDGFTEPVEKETFVRPFEMWNWVIGSGIYLDDIEAAVAEREGAMTAKIRQSVLVYLGLTAAISIIVLIILLFLIRRITKPIEDVVDWSKELADGNLIDRLSINDESEIGRQARNLNQAAESIRTLMERIKSLTGRADEVKERLAASTEETGFAVDKISGRLQSVHERFEEMESGIDESSNAAIEIDALLTSLNGGIDRQANAMEESVSAVNEMLASVDQVAKTSEAKSESIAGLKGILEDCRGRFVSMNESIDRLSEAGEDMKSMASLISGIASRSNLLSMNAAIEAAHAGDSGRGFAVVAEEIRNLAVNAGGNARKIKETLDDDVREIESLLAESRHMNDIYQTLESEVGSMAETLLEISSSMTEMTNNSRGILQSVDTLKTVSVEVLEGSSKMESGNAVVKKTVRDVAEVSADVGQSIDEVLEEARRIDRIVQELDDQVRSMVDSIGGISREIGRFRT